MLGRVCRISTTVLILKEELTPGYACSPNQFCSSPPGTSTARAENSNCRGEHMTPAESLPCFREISAQNRGTRRELQASFPTWCTAEGNAISHRGSGMTQFSQCQWMGPSSQLWLAFRWEDRTPVSRKGLHIAP